jgi:hypothetical protein
MRIDSSGNVGIGTTSPDKLLHLAASSGATLRLESTTSGATTGDIFGAIEFETQDSNSAGVKGKIDSYSEGGVGNAALRFFTGNTTELGERMRIDSSGRLMVGTTSALAGNSKLSIVGEATAGQQQVTLHNPATSGTRYFMAFGTEASYTERGYIAYNGSSVFVGTVSDIKLKENIRDLDNGLSVISKIKPRVFDWKDGHEKNAVGFISQEIEEIKPDWVNEKDNIKFIESNLTSSIPYIIKAIQEQQEQIETLKAEVQELKDNG